MRASASVAFLLALLGASAAADPCPPPSRWMLDVVRHATRVRLVRVGGREQAKNPFARDTTFLGYRALGGADLGAAAASRVAAAFGRPAHFGCGEMRPDTLFVGPLQLGFDFEAPLFGRLRIVLLEPERTVQMYLDSGSYTEAKLSDQGLRAWHAALSEILRQRGERRADFERRMSPPPRPFASTPARADAEVMARVLHDGEIDSTRVVDLTQLRKPQLEATTKVSPAYPDRAREAGVDGTVIVAVLVDPHGVVRDVRVVKSIPMLDAAAMDAVRQWRFTPYLDEGIAVSAWTRVPVRFSLH